MMKKPRNQKTGTTLDGLARMIQGEFSASRKETNERFNKVDERFNKVDDDILWIHGSLDVMRQEIGEIRSDLGNVVYRHHPRLR